jgi:Tfp pilus assembly protein PilW
VIRQFASAARGATLIENMVALLLGSVTVISLYAYFRSEIYHALIVETRIAVLEDARGALDIMLRDLKNAGSWGSGSVPVETGVGDDPSHDADSVCNRVYAASWAVRLPPVQAAVCSGAMATAYSPTWCPLREKRCLLFSTAAESISVPLPL